MSKKNKIVNWILIPLMFACVSSRAQELKNKEIGTWFTVLNQVKKGDWSFSNEVHERTGSFLNHQGQFLIRPSIDYHLNERINFSVGYTYINVRSYDPYFLPLPKTEHNIWEQLIHMYRSDKFTLLHRLRFEHRFVEKHTVYDGIHYVDGWHFSNRVRYRINPTWDVHIFNKEKGNSLFINGFDELWINQNRRLLPISFARNWIYIGAGYRFDASTNIQLGYLHQYDFTGSKFISSHVIQTTFVKNFKLN